MKNQDIKAITNSFTSNKSFALLYLGYFISSIVFLSKANISLNPLDAQLVMQSLDLNWIKEDFLGSLLYNHYQPPLFSNFILGGFYILFNQYLIPVYLGMNIILSLSAFILFIQMQQKIGLSKMAIWITALLFLFYPYRFIEESSVLYGVLCMFLVTLSSWLFLIFIEKPNRSRFVAFSALLLLISWSNSYFHFMWCILLLGIALFLSKQWKRYWLGCVLAIVLILIVPFKNYLMFGNFASSSCSGIVLAQKVGGRQYPDDVKKYIQSGDLPPEAEMITRPYDARLYMSYAHLVPKEFQTIKLLGKPFKDYAPWKSIEYNIFNYNFYPMLLVSKRMTEYSLKFLKLEPMAYVKMTLFQFVYFFSVENSHVLEPLIPITKVSIAGNIRLLSYRGLLYLISLAMIGFYILKRWGSMSGKYRVSAFVWSHAFYGAFMGIVIAHADAVRYRFVFELMFLLLLSVMIDYVVRRIIAWNR